MYGNVIDLLPRCVIDLLDASFENSPLRDIVLRLKDVFGSSVRGCTLRTSSEGGGVGSPNADKGDSVMLIYPNFGIYSFISLDNKFSYVYSIGLHKRPFDEWSSIGVPYPIAQ